VKCIAIGNMKGGVGKSTLAVHIGCELAARNRSVVLFDADVQGTATDWCNRGALPIQCETIPIESVEVAQTLIRRVRASPMEIAVIDLPPHTREATEAALMACDLFLIPVTPSGADFTATRKLLSLLQDARALRNGSPKALMVPSRVDRRTSFGKEVSDALTGFGEPVGPPIGQRSVYVDCFGLADWVGRVYPHSTAYSELQQLTTLIEEMI